MTTAQQHDARQSRIRNSLRPASVLSERAIRGEVSSTPWHHGPVIAETADIADELIAINRTCFVTTSSQPDYLRSRLQSPSTLKEHLEDSPFVSVFGVRQDILLLSEALGRRGHIVFAIGGDSRHVWRQMPLRVRLRHLLASLVPSGDLDELWVAGGRCLSGTFWSDVIEACAAIERGDLR